MITKKYENLLEPLCDSDKDAVRHLTRLFNKHNRQLYMVGGCVRDLLLNREPKDIDLCTDATPDEMKEILADTDNFESWDSGLKHGTITVTENHWYFCSFEITTFRGEGNYSDHRHPDEVVFTKSLEEDLFRRDLTINSFAYNALEESLYYLDESYWYDLQLGIIKAVGNPVKRFEEDALRMLRAIRFSAQLGFAIDYMTLNAINEKADTLKYVSRERIRDELTKILMSDNPQTIELIAMTDLQSKSLPNLPLKQMLCESQHNKWHYTDVFHHTMDVVKAVPKDFELRWAAFFHDWGKMSCVSTDADGWEHYYGHPDISAKMALDFMEEFKFDNTSKENIYKLVKYHDREIGSKVKMLTFKKFINALGDELFPKFVKLTHADRMAHKLLTTEFAVGNLSSALYKYIVLKTEQAPMKIKDLAINGEDIKADGFLKGKEIGQCLNWILDQVLEHPEYNTRTKLLELLEVFKQMSFQNS